MSSVLCLKFLFILILSRVHKIFLYDDDLTKAKFSFGHLISHKNPKTGKHDMKVSCLTKAEERKETSFKCQVYLVLRYTNWDTELKLK